MWRYTMQSPKWKLFLLFLLIVLLFFCEKKASQAEEVYMTEAIATNDNSHLVKEEIANNTEIHYGYNASPLNIRAEMSVESDWVGQYASQSTIILLEDLGDWYRVEKGYVKREYVLDAIAIYQRGLVLKNAPIYAEPKVTLETFGYVEEKEELIFVRKENGFLELFTGGFVKEDVVTFEFTPAFVLQETNLTIADMQKENMCDLPIQYLGTLATRVPGEGVTVKSSLYFQGELPIYTIIDHYAYFPSGRNIYKIALDNFTELKNVGASYDILAAYRTVYFDSSQSRKHNIALVATYLDGTIISSGKTFSYNRTTGPRNASMGYEKAGVISNGDIVQDYGGGVCQVSSTIYAAVKNTQGIRVTARKPHGVEVLYLPVNMDATVSYDSVDFKFVNEFPFSIELHVTTENSTCLVTITRK